MKAHLTLVIFIFVIALVNAQTPSFSVAEVGNYNKVSTSNSSEFYTLTLKGDESYDNEIYLVTLEGSRYQMGYDYGVLVGQLAYNMYNTIVSTQIKSKILLGLIEDFADWQWEYLSQAVPQDYMDEIQGITQAGIDNGIKSLGTVIQRIIVLANLPSDLIDMQYVLEEELEDFLKKKLHLSIEDKSVQESFFQTIANDQFVNKLRRFSLEHGKGLQCSNFGVWGSRTEGGKMYSARNLDYAPNLGVNSFKLITIWKPTDGGYSHVSFGYTGLYGALTGMNEHGLMVGEANLEVDVETFFGFPWILRLRYIMENAKTIQDSYYYWEFTDNTVGYNHLIASAVDAANNNTHCALAIETMAGYNGFFLDNDPRELGATTLDYQTNETIVYGTPLNEAVWRTNHGYDPIIRSHYMWKTFHAGVWSVERYGFIHSALVEYEMTNTPISYFQAINITSIVGDKGEQDPYVCQDNNSGTNILSVTYANNDDVIYAAWGNGSGSNWRPAACNIYVKIEMSQFW